MPWDEFVSPVVLSLQVAFVSSWVVFAIGLLAAWFMAGTRFAGKTLVETLFILPLVLPPTVVGLILLVGLGRRSLPGRWIEALSGEPIVFTWWAAVLASVVVSFPLVYQTVKSGFLSVDRELQESARSMGAGELQVLRYITLPLSLRSLMTGYILGFARALGEFGATLMVAGNIPGRTRTLPTAIYTAVDAGHMALAWAWTGSIVVISFGLLLLVRPRGKE